DRTPHHLVGMLRIDPQPQRHLDGLVELCVFHFLQKWNRLLQRIGPRLDCLPRLLDILSRLLHVPLSLPPPRRCSEEPWCFRLTLACVVAGLRPAGTGQSPVTTRKFYPTTSIPIDRAVPRTLLMAASTDAAFRSGIFCFAMSSTCFSVTLPTLSLLGAPDPLAMPAARFSNIEAGGVLVMNVNERSLYTVITTGTINPSSSFCPVRALNCLQNSMMLTCACPSAGPTGGAGVALPAAICNFTEPVTFFAMMPFPYLRTPAPSLGFSAQRSDHLISPPLVFGRSQCQHHDRNQLFLHRICGFTLNVPITVFPYATFSTCPNSNSTGVERPKMVTITFKVSRSSFTSSTTPVKVANGPSPMRTVSPF